VRRFRVTVVAVEKKQVLNITSLRPYSCLSYPACNLHLLRRIILSPVACLVVPHFFLLSHKCHDFREKMLLNIKFFFYKFCLKHFSFYEKFSKISSKTYNGLHAKTRYPCHILISFEFSQQFSKPPRENRPVGAEVLYADRQTRRK
jgi:hypothetical protein